MGRTAAMREASSEPPSFLRLVAHPVRWRLLQELVYSDRAVWEVGQLLDESQGWDSYHLNRLRGDGLVSKRQSSFDRRDAYYAADLERCQTLLQAAGGALHPALWLEPVSPAGRPHGRSRPKRRVLFLCTGN